MRLKKNLVIIMSFWILLLALSITVQAQDAQNQLLLKRGHVQIKRGESIWKTVADQFALGNNLWIKTGVNASAILKLADGTILKMGDNTVLLIKTLEANNINIMVTRGNVIAEVKSPDGKFHILSPTSKGSVKQNTTLFISVLGNAERELTTCYYVKKGEVEVVDSRSNDKVLVKELQPVIQVNRIKWSMNINVPLNDIRTWQLYFIEGYVKGKSVSKSQEIIKQLNLQINILKQEIDREKKENQSLQKQMANANRKVKAKTELNTIEKNIKTLEKKQKSMETSLNKLEKKKEKLDNYIATKNKEAKEVTELRKQKQSLAKEMKAANKSQKNAANQVKKSQAEKTKVEKQIKDLIAKYKKYKKDLGIDELKKQQKKLESNVKSLEGKAKSMTKKTESTNKAMAKLQENLKKLKNANSKMRKETKTFAKQRSVLKKEIYNLEKDLLRLRTQIDNIIKKVRSQKAEDEKEKK